jgi:hypothetical protein
LHFDEENACPKKTEEKRQNTRSPLYKDRFIWYNKTDAGDPAKKTV